MLVGLFGCIDDTEWQLAQPLPVGAKSFFPAATSESSTGAGVCVCEASIAGSVAPADAVFAGAAGGWNGVPLAATSESLCRRFTHAWKSSGVWTMT